MPEGVKGTKGPATGRFTKYVFLYFPHTFNPLATYKNHKKTSIYNNAIICTNNTLLGGKRVKYVLVFHTDLH